MKYLFSLFFACLFITSCTCDEPYCPNIEEIQITIRYDDDFWGSELRNSKLYFIDTVTQTITDSIALVEPDSRARSTWLQYYHEFPNRNEIIVLKFYDFSDTLRDFNFTINQTTYRCKSDCFPSIGPGALTDYTETNDFFFTYKGDTIRDKTVFIEK